jgi:MOSC N-terminal beta barrel domain
MAIITAMAISLPETKQTEKPLQEARTMYIQELWRYPVKSLAGEQLQEVELTLRGVSAPGDDFST